MNHGFSSDRLTNADEPRTARPLTPEQQEFARVLGRLLALMWENRGAPPALSLEQFDPLGLSDTDRP
jgi:hypothetical protein